MNLNNYLDAARVITGSDYKTAKRLKVTTGMICAARKKGSMSPDLARRLAEIIEVSPLDIIAAAEIAKHPERAKAWERWIKVVCILIAASAINVLPIQDVRADSRGNDLYIMRILRWLIRINSAVRKRTWKNYYSSQPKPA